jgi:Holliday junction resolvasome RuvABC ATP-dependent DNA helicase subunit
MKDIFTDFIGQRGPRKTLNFMFDDWMGSRLMPNLMFIAPRGHGKTAFATALGFAMQKHRSAKRFVVKTASSWRNLDQFMADVIARDVMNGECCVLIDEAHELPMDVQTALLTMLADSKENRTSYSHGDVDINIDFTRHTFLFATTEPHKVFHALMSRLWKIDLDTYTPEQLGKIVKSNLPKVRFGKGVLESVSSILRDEPRKAVQYSNRIFSFLKSRRKKALNMKDWEILCDYLNVKPLGLTASEIRCLRALGTGTEFSLTHLASKLDMEAAAVRTNIEIFLLKKNLMQVKPTGRSLTKAGQKYLKEYATICGS